MNFSKPPVGRYLLLPARALSLAAAFLCAFLLPAVAARADTSTSLTIVGTSDVSDSGLMQNLIQPQFEAAYPQFSPFKYTGSATGTAISNAESGAGGPSVLIVHAASLENQFVAGGYSYEPFGRAIFTNDFVFAGPTADPAGVASNGSNNIVQAFADVAAAGIAGNAEFVSRGGGAAGTSVQEHAIWALVNQMASPPAGLVLCALSAANGGGDAPIAASSGITETTPATPCPGAGSVPSRISGTLPPWYDATTLTQGPNVVAANACTGYAKPNSCYVFTDRGTFDYLSSGLDPQGQTGQVNVIPGLKIVTRNNSASAPGGANELVNYFHAYIINPAVSHETVNLTAAQAFVNFLTSPSFQAQLKTYLPAGTSGDPAGAPFVADASPTITEAGIPGSLHVGKPVIVSGTVTNAEPGYPVLTGKTVTVEAIEAGVPVPVASGTTDATGAYSITFVPPSSGAYQVSTGAITQIENSQLNPAFGDLLSPGATSAVQLTLTGVPSSTSVKFTRLRARKGRVTVRGTLTPAPTASGAHIELFALRTVTVTRKGSRVVATRASASFKRVAKVSVKPGHMKFTIRARLKRGYRWVLQLEYVQNGQTSAYSRLRTIDVH